MCASSCRCDRTGAHDLIIAILLIPIWLVIPAILMLRSPLTTLLAPFCLYLRRRRDAPDRDHGNCEIMWDDETGSPHTAHSYNLVPAWLVGDGESACVMGWPILPDTAGVDGDKPAAMTGESLLD